MNYRNQIAFTFAAVVMLLAPGASAWAQSQATVSKIISKAAQADPALAAAAAVAARSGDDTTWAKIEQSPAQIAVPEGKPALAPPTEEERRHAEKREAFILDSKQDIMRASNPRMECIDGLAKLKYDKAVAGVLCFSPDPDQAYGCFLDGMDLNGGQRQDAIIKTCSEFSAPQMCTKVVSGGHWESSDCFGRFGIASVFSCNRRWVNTTRSYQIRCDQLPRG